MKAQLTTLLFSCALAITAQNPNPIREMNKHFQPAVSTGTYGDSNVADEALWAATELFFSTRDNKYLEPIAQNYQSLSFSNPS